MALPAGEADHQIALVEFRMTGVLDTADSATGHHFADLYRRGVGRCIAHAPAHVRIQRQVQGFQQHLAVFEIRQRFALQTEVFRSRRAHRT